MTHWNSKNKNLYSTSSVTVIGKVLGVVAVVTLLALGGLWFLKSPARESSPAAESTGGGTPKVTIDPKSIDFGTMPMSQGVVEKTYSVKNEGSGALRVSNLVTSCMCTSAQLEVGTEKSLKFGMVGMGISSRGWSMELPAGGSGILHVFFDPNAHGPAGVGPIDRTVSFDTNDPANKHIEVAFHGLVVR